MIALNCWLPTEWKGCIERALGEAVNQAFGGFFKLIFDAITAVVVAAVEDVLKAVGLLWVYIKTPDIAQSGPVDFIQVHTNYILGVVAFIAVIVGAVQMAISHRGEPLKEILKSLLTMVVVSFSGALFAGTLIAAADDFSAWIIGQSLNTNGHSFAKSLAEKMVDPLKDPGNLMGFMLVICVGVLMVITAIIQLALMIVRYGMLVLLVGVLPLTAAATNTEMGMMWFKKAIGWLAGFIIYKPVAALIYATAIYLMSPPDPAGGTAPDGTSQTLKIVMGITMMIMAVVALPALLRFVSPRTS
ncbi:type IV secretion system protein [Kribbella solani]|uniref:TrbL/VirB6 plasmid conjugal transfer protein n=1 Tax=Kribbella solani TaxID=236067 RepID=A0A841DZ46_9ACTN|nr:type IV secretion system protein [Kribbella solani]MBB5982045.1 hypothetical protein [Kribbella solani]